MSKPKNHILNISEKYSDYAEARTLDFKQFTPYHMTITDGGYVKLDLWTTGRYFVEFTDYLEMTDGNVVERGREKGNVPINTLEEWLDDLFFPETRNGIMVLSNTRNTIQWQENYTDESRNAEIKQYDSAIRELQRCVEAPK